MKTLKCPIFNQKKFSYGYHIEYFFKVLEDVQSDYKNATEVYC